MQREAMLEASPDPLACLRRCPDTFRASLESGNRMCLCS